MSNSLLGLEGKNVLVLGGGCGMGESSSLLLARAGANVAVGDIDRGLADSVAGSVRQLGRNAVPIVLDALDDGQLKGAIAQAERDLGMLDGLVAIVGMAAFAPILGMTAETWDLDHRRNLRYFFFAAAEVARRLIARGSPGSIVCIASVDGIRSAPYHAAYGAAKAGLIHLVGTMAAEWAAHGIRVNAIAPGVIVTPRFPLRAPNDEAEQTAFIPARRRGTTDEIGKGVLFMLSDLASYVNGQTLAVDGGFTAVGPVDYGPLKRRLRVGEPT